MSAPVTIIIPAHNEADYITACLGSLIDQDAAADPMHVIVAANACTDATVALCRDMASQFSARGSTLTVLDLPNPGKIEALNVAEASLDAGMRVYLDADVTCDADMMSALRTALSAEAPTYATGRLRVAQAKSLFTRAYARLWQKLPFFESGAVGAGLFALNATGRARWGAFPAIISDDTFVRLSFAPSERIEVASAFTWPMVEGFSSLVKVRRRQDAGVTEVKRLFPDLMANDEARRLSRAETLKLALRMPLDFLVYMSVYLAVRSKPADTEWTRGR